MPPPDAERVRTASRVFSDPRRAAEHLGVGEREYLELCRRFGVALPGGEELARWTLPPAGRFRRLLAWAADLVILVAIAGLAGLGSLDFGSAGGGAIVEGKLGPTAYLLLFLYFWMLEGRFGRTAGKWALGMRVVDEEGMQPSLLRALARTAIRFIPFEALAIFGAAGRCLHDTFSGTRVVVARRARTESGRAAG
ncbi:MAG: RDD family protein [Nitrospinota bacterium]